MNEAEDRKQRSIKILKARGLPVLDSLPEIETVEDTTIRSGEAIVRRILCLTAVARAAFVGQTDPVLPFVARWKLDPHLTPDEREFLQSGKVVETDGIKFSWRIEAIVPLAWAIGLYADLWFPEEETHAEDVLEYWESFSHPDLTRIGHREAADILDQADLIYRAHWAVREGASNGLHGGVVRERHHALNWLICYEDDDWDDVQTDT
ncbi:DUF4272 domain-containing protein [Asticcacaulis sp. YBE204]|uniref:DUF4272 domain-containing protein n=1 Tax=Asticcacaulis sp. YBE204 TaxID=1282363 RepID=UPI0003C3C0AF|nr:DUF4272 domain-containing protein [Asticcacaulis sp. YBE204]ESQ79788.1 hypothetical protein AEYBE204_08055 [Asticcacaulis sp. YBE204]